MKKQTKEQEIKELKNSIAKLIIEGAHLRDAEQEHILNLIKSCPRCNNCNEGLPDNCCVQYRELIRMIRGNK